MKVVYVALVLLCTLTLVCAATVNPSPDSKATQATQQSGQPAGEQVSIPASSPSAQSAAVMSRAEADSLRVQGDRLLAQSGVDEITVGSIGSDDLIYILVVVLLVVVIIAVVH